MGAAQPKEIGTKQSVNLRTERQHFYTGICNTAGANASHDADAELAQGGFFFNSRGAKQMKCIARDIKKR